MAIFYYFLLYTTFVLLGRNNVLVCIFRSKSADLPEQTLISQEIGQHKTFASIIDNLYQFFVELEFR
jgi:hypothetical protein